MTRLLFLALLLTLPAQAQEASTRMQEALRLERSMGDYEGAISIYRDIAGDAGADRRVVAQALIQLGKAYESLGRTEAFDAYQRVARDFSDQEDLVAEARERMAGLAEEAAPEYPEQLNVAPELLMSLGYPYLSDDGKTFINLHWPSKLIAIQELGADQLTYLTPGREFPEGRPWTGQYDAELSPDGSMVAFQEDWGGRDDRWSALWVWHRETGQADMISEPPDTWFGVLDWTPNGDAILVKVDDNDIGDGLQLIDPTSGDILYEFRLADTDNLSNETCMIDQERAVYGSSEGVYVHHFTSGESTRLYGSDVRLMACSAASAKIVFQDEQGSERRVWVTDIENGRPIGLPERLPDVDPDFSIVGMTTEGTLAYVPGQRPGFTGILEFDFDLLEIGEKVESLPNGTPVGWSRDGTQFAHAIEQNIFLIRENEGDRRFVVNDHTWRVGWTPDGSGLFSQSRQKRGTTNWYDMETGAVVDSLSGHEAGAGADGTELWFSERVDDSTMCVRGRGLLEKIEREIVCYEDDLAREGVAVSLSPDGKHVLVQDRKKDFSAIVVRVVGLESDSNRLLGEFDWYWDSQWLPDGRVIVLRNLRETGAQFMVYSLDGSAPVQAFKRFADGRHVSAFVVHPTEPKIAVRTWFGSTFDFEGVRLVHNAW